MAKLIATRGLPGCGKTTWAEEWVAVDRLRRARANRDDFRAMAHKGVFIKGDATGSGTEKAILAARDATITAWLKLGLDVVCDDTNLPSRTVRDLRRLAVLAGAEVEIVDMTDVPLATCIERDAARERTVGREVIEQHYLRFVKGKAYPLPVSDEPEDSTTAAVPYEPKPGTPKAILVDLDGTVALMANRGPYDEDRVHDDRPNEPVIAAVRAMHAAGHTVVFASGRHDTCREATEKWLAEHVGVPYAGLFMRAAGDMRKDSLVKAELFDAHIRDQFNVVAVFDDRNQVVRMWREFGLTVFQVAEGDF
jgi:predicted kinase